MSPSAGFTSTSANLRSIGGQPIPAFLKTAFPDTDTTPAEGVSSSAPVDPKQSTVVRSVTNKHFVDSAMSSIDDIISTALIKSAEKEKAREVDGEDAEKRDREEVPLYIKVKGKGKGKPVMFDHGKSATAQVYGKSTLPTKNERRENGILKDVFCWVGKELAAQKSYLDPEFDCVASGAA